VTGLTAINPGRRSVARAWLLAAFVAATGCGEETRAPPPVSSLRVLEAPLVPLSPGGRESLSEYRGQRVIVNFWATWCAPCREEMPGLQRLSETLAPRGVAVVGVSVDTDLNLAREFLLRHRVSFDNFADAGMAHSRGALGITALPVTFALDSEGKIAGRALGARDWAGAGGQDFLRQAYGNPP